MQTVLYHLTTISVFAVILVLLFGLWNLARGQNPNLSQTLMRWRVGLQALAIAIIVAYVMVQQWH